LWWRSVGSSHTPSSTETFLDELAKAAGAILRAAARAAPEASAAPRRPRARRGQGGLGIALARGARARDRGPRVFRQLRGQRGRGHARIGRFAEGRARGVRGRLRHRGQPAWCALRWRAASGSASERRSTGRSPSTRAGSCSRTSTTTEAAHRRHAKVEVHIVPSAEPPTGVRRAGRSLHRPGRGQRSLPADGQANLPAAVHQGHQRARA
jgi:hypothetical protein